MKLTINEIAYLSKHFAERSELSLFSTANAIPTGEEEKSLTEKGVMKDGAVTESAKKILNVAAKAEKSSRMVLKAGGCIVEKYTYRVADSIILAENDGGDLLFSQPDYFEIQEEIAQFTGQSMIKSADIQLVISFDELIVFLAMVDLYRKNVMLNYVGEEKADGPFSEQEIEKQFKETAKNSLAQMVIKNYEMETPATESIKEILGKLAEKACVKIENGYALTDEFMIFAKSFLMPETLITNDLLNINEKKELEIVSTLFVCAGIRDILAIVFGSDEVELTSVSGSQMQEILTNFLKCPDTI